MLSLIIPILLMALILVVLVLKPELGMQFKAFTEKSLFDAEWKPSSKGTRWRFVAAGIFIEAVFLFVLIVLLILK
jgi:hypothetical protein